MKFRNGFLAPKGVQGLLMELRAFSLAIYSGSCDPLGDLVIRLFPVNGFL